MEDRETKPQVKIKKKQHGKIERQRHKEKIERK